MGLSSYYWSLARTSDSRRTSRSSPSSLISVPPYLEYRTSSPSTTSSGTRLPVSSLILPSPTARTLPFCGFSFAVSGSTRPEAVVSSSSTALTINRSPRGLSFMPVNLHSDRARSALQTGECHPRASYVDGGESSRSRAGGSRRWSQTHGTPRRPQHVPAIWRERTYSHPAVVGVDPPSATSRSTRR